MGVVRKRGQDQELLGQEPQWQRTPETKCSIFNNNSWDTKKKGIQGTADLIAESNHTQGITPEKLAAGDQETVHSFL